MRRYAWARLRPRQPPQATAFDTFLRPGAPAAAPQQPAKRPPADFRAFLKHAPAAPPARDAASFASFLRKPQAADTDAGTSVHASGEGEAAADAGPSPEQKVVCVLFGTEYGFSKEIAEKAAARLRESPEYWCGPCMLYYSGLAVWPLCRNELEQERLHACACRPQLLDMAELAEGHLGLASEQALLVVCSTQVPELPSFPAHQSNAGSLMAAEWPCMQQWAPLSLEVQGS
jgi:sulfite reductase (NADPH) flavoprotein alpha-component